MKLNRTHVVLIALLGFAASAEKCDKTLPSCPGGATPSVTIVDGQPVVSCPAQPPSVEPSLPPPASPVPSPVEPQESPKPSPSATALPPSPPAPPTPCTVPGTCAEGCTTCSAWIAANLASGDVQRCEAAPRGFGACKAGYVWNDRDGDPTKRDCFDSTTCWLMWCDGSGVRSKKRLESEVCASDCTKPTPCVTPTPKPPSPPASPLPPQEEPPLTENGNYPVPPAGTCPAWFRNGDSFPALLRVGVSVPNYNPEKGLFGTPCGDGSNCRRFTIWATQKSFGKFCEHRCWENGVYTPGICKNMRECELFAGCQEPQFVDYVNVDDAGNGGGVLIQITSDAFEPPWNTQWGRADKQTCSDKERRENPSLSNCVHNFNAHDKAVNRPGVTRVRACMPNGTKCSETFYRTDGR